MAQRSENKKRKAPVEVRMRTPKAKIARFAEVVSPLFAEFEAEDKTSPKGLRLRLKFAARYTKLLVLYSHAGLTLSDSQHLYIRCGKADDETLNQYCETVSSWAVLAYEAAKEETQNFFGEQMGKNKSEEPHLIVEGGTSNFGKVLEKTFFPGKYTKYFSKHFTQPMKDSTATLLMGKGNSRWAITTEIGTMDITYNKMDHALILTPYVNINDITWLFHGQNTHVEDTKAEDMKADYRLRLEGFITNYLQKQDDINTAEAKKAMEEDQPDAYSTEDSESPEEVLPKSLKEAEKTPKKKTRGRPKKSTDK